jgi:hypothetical protein
MNCPHCGRPTRVKRTTTSGAAVLRRRVCEACGFRITTAERPVGQLVDLPGISAQSRISIGDLLALCEKLARRPTSSG